KMLGFDAGAESLYYPSEGVRPAPIIGSGAAALPPKPRRARGFARTSDTSGEAGMGSNSSVRLLRREHSTPIPDDGSPATTNDSHDFRFTIHYPSRLRPNRVGSITVSLEPVRPLDRVLDIKRKKSENALPLRLLVPGAIVTPGEHAVEP